MSRPVSAAALEEQAELRNLRDAADQSAADVAKVLAELTRRLTAARQPKEAARQLAARVRVTATRTLRAGWDAGWERTGGQRGAWRPALAVVPVLAVATALGYATRRNFKEKADRPGRSARPPGRVSRRR